MKDIFCFNTMLTPKIIVVVYWLLLFSVLVSGFGTMFAVSGFGGILSGLFVMMIGALGVRIWCELLIVLFKIHDNLKKLADREA